MHKRLNYDQSNKFNRIRSKSHSSDEESFNAIREKLKKKPADQKSSKVHPSTETGPSTSAGIFKKISKQTLQEYNNTQRNLKTKFKVSQTVDCIERDPVYYKRHKNLNEDPSKLVIGRRQDEGNKPLFDRTDILVNQKENDSKRSRSRSTSPERKRKSRSRSFDSESERNRPRQYRKRSRSSSRSSRHSDHHKSNNRKQHRRSHSRSRSSSTPERKPYYLDDKRERERLERERRLRLEGPVRRRTRSRSRERNPPPTHTIVVMPPYGFPGPYSFPPYHYQPQFPPGVAPFPPYPHPGHQRMPPQRFPPSHPGMMPRPHFDPNMPRAPPHFDPNMPRPPPFHGFPPRFPQRPRFPPQNQRFRHPRPQGPNPRMQHPNNRGKKRK